ncbi:MAG TPA: hypothetical protein VKE94_08055 [Gemmataceae bacterium]|nr:hypothetical protein [Gemmataceae bacterium]
MSIRLVVLALLGVGTWAFALGCKDNPSAGSPEEHLLSPEQARAALVDLLKSQPEAFAKRFYPDEYAGKPLEDRGDGKYRWGWFLIDMPRASFQLGLEGREHSIEYVGEFQYLDGRWIAKKTGTTYACGK